MSLRQIERGTNRSKQAQAGGESRREATREREMRDWKAAVDKGYRNKAIEGFLKR